MMKKIAILALAASAAFSNAFADGPNCTVNLSGDFVFSGYQKKPEVKKVVCDGNPVYGESDFKVLVATDKITYGKNVNAGVDAGSVFITLPEGDVIEEKFEIEKLDIEIKINSVEKEKGTVDPEFTAEMIPLENGVVLDSDTLSNLKTSLAKAIALERKNKGEEIADENGVPYKYEITLLKDATRDVAQELKTKFPNYKIMVGEKGFLTITKTKIHVVGQSYGKKYGDPDPKFEYVIDGHIDPADYGKLGKITLTRAEGEDVTQYGYRITVNLEKTETEDYIIQAVDAVLYIEPAEITVTAEDKNKIYGNATPEFTYKVEGLVKGDELNDVDILCAECLSSGLEPVGEYEISVSVKAASNPNYKVTMKSGTFKVTPRAATVTLGSAEKTYGDKDPEFEYTVEGLVEGESLKGVKIDRATGEKIGTYQVDGHFDESLNGNYKLTVKSGSLKITPKDVVLTADDVSKKFGEADPELTYSVEGLVTIDGVEDKLSGVKLSREKGENAGSYAITATVDAKANPNYKVTVAEGGVLTIIANDDKIVVTIKGHSSTGVYNGKEQSVHGFDMSTNSTAFSLKFVEFKGDSVVKGTNAGKYEMGLSKDNFKNTSVNYPNVEFEVTDGSLEITPKSIVVSAVADSIEYGNETPADFKWTVDSLLTGDELDNIHVGISKTGLLAAGEYVLDFDQKTPSNPNYVVTEFVPAVFKVKPRTVTVTIGDTSKVYGSPDPEQFNVKIEGLVEGDNLGEYTVAREPGENVLKKVGTDEDSSYRISATFTAENPNYILKITQGHFKIKPYTEKITVAIFGKTVVMKYTGETITVPKSFDVAMMSFEEKPLPDSLAYKQAFVFYKGDSTISGTMKYIYPMNLKLEDFVNISPNFENVNFVLSSDGTLIINDEGEIPTKLASVKVAADFRLSSIGRRIQVNGSTVGKSFAVVDMHGKTIRSGVVNSANFEVPVPSAGVYMVRVGRISQRVRVK